MQRNELRSLLTDNPDSTLREIAEAYPVPFDQEELFQRSYAKFQGEAEQPGVMRPLWRRTVFRTITAAACLILTVGSAVGIWAKQQRIESGPQQETTVTTSTQTGIRPEQAPQIFTEPSGQRTTETANSHPIRTETIATRPETTAAASPVLTTAAMSAAQTELYTATSAIPTNAAQTAARTERRTTFTEVRTVPAAETNPTYHSRQTAAEPAASGTAVTTAWQVTTAVQTPESTSLPETGTTMTTGTRTARNKEDLLMEAKKLKNMLAMINAAATTAALATTTAITTTATETTPIDLTDPPANVVTQYGDINLDQDVGLSDLIQLQRFLLGQDYELDNWQNADLCPDGVIDAFDLAVLKKELLGNPDRIGGSLRVDVVDMMSDAPIRQATVYLVGLKDDYAYELAEFDYDPDTAENNVIYGLPTDSSYSYMLFVENIPDSYGMPDDRWNQEYMFSYDGENVRKDVKLRICSTAETPNVKVHLFDWSVGEDVDYYGRMKITDRDGNPYYPTQNRSSFALPDGDYHLDLYTSDIHFPVQLLSPDSEYTKYLQEKDPDTVIPDQSKGIDFSVRNGEPDRELKLHFGPLDGKRNHLTIRCVDAYTGEPVEGVKLSLIENPRKDPRVTETWTSDATGTKSFDDLRFCGDTVSYQVKVDSVPEGYSGGFDKDVSWGYVYDYEEELTYSLIPDNTEKNFSIDVLDWTDHTVLNGEDMGTYQIWKRGAEDFTGSYKIMDNVKPGEKISLPDGDYFADLSWDYKEKGYRALSYTVYKDKPLFQNGTLSLAEFAAKTDSINFTIKDGKPTKPAVFYLKVYDPADLEVPQAAYDAWDEEYREMFGPFWNPDPTGELADETRRESDAE